MEIEELKRIIRLLKDEGLSEITICEKDSRITVRRDLAAPSASESGVGTGKESAYEDGLSPVVAPLVGTFYRRRSPEDEPFVSEGSRVKPGDTLCIIEAMKVLNEIKAEEEGVLQQILVEDGEPVEYGQVLFLLERK